MQVDFISHRLKSSQKLFLLEKFSVFSVLFVRNFASCFAFNPCSSEFNPPAVLQVFVRKTQKGFLVGVLCVHNSCEPVVRHHGDSVCDSKNFRHFA